MKRLGLVTALLLSMACTKNVASVKEASVEQVAQWLKDGAATVFDANVESFRQNNGVVTGAVLLTSFNSYDVKVLGEDKARQLVFYCTNRL